MFDPGASQDENVRAMLRELRLLLSRVSYRPGWKLVLDRVDQAGVRVEVRGPVYDADQPDRLTSLTVPKYIGFMELLELTRSPRLFLAWVHEFLMDVERHECGEWFRFDDRKPYDPHVSEVDRAVRGRAMSTVLDMMRRDAADALTDMRLAVPTTFTGVK